MLKVKVPEADGGSVTRAEIFSLYASDMRHVPFLRKIDVTNNGTAGNS